MHVAQPLFDSTLLNNLIAGNTGPTDSPDVAGEVNSLGGNLIGNATGSTGFIPGEDLIGTSAAPINPLLGPLANNGGPTQTHALLSGSPAINRGINASLPSTDQRGLPRLVGPRVDSGAFESQPNMAPRPTPITTRVTTVEDTAVGGQLSAVDPENNPFTFSSPPSSPRNTAR